MNPRQELAELRRLDELEHRAAGTAPQGRRYSPADLQRMAAESAQDPTNVPEEPSPLARVGRGFLDIGTGIKQNYLLATDPAAATDMTQSETGEVDQYQRNLDKTRGPGIDWFRAGGQALPAIPAGMAMAPAAGAGYLTLAGNGALAGALQGASTFTPSETGSIADVLTGKLTQAGAGAATGAVAAPAITAATRGAAWVGNKLGNAAQSIGRLFRSMNPNAQQRIIADIRIAAPKLGLDWDALDESAQHYILDQAAEQLKNGTLNPEALLRMQDYKALGIQPTRAMVTRDAADWQMERDLARTDSGAPLRSRFIDANQKLIGAVEDARPGAAMQETPEQAGTFVRDTAQRADKVRGKVVGRQYEAARSNAGDAYEVAPQKLVRLMDDMLDRTEMDPLTESIRRRMTRIGVLKDGQIPQADDAISSINLDSAEELRKFIGSLPSDTPTKRLAIRQLLSALDDDLKGAVDTQGNTPAVDLYGRARGAAKARFDLRDPDAIQKLVRGETAGEDVFADGVLNADVRDVAALKRFLMTGTSPLTPHSQAQVPPVANKQGAQAWEELRAQAIEFLKRQALGRAGEEGTFSGLGWKEGLRKLGQERLSLLFNPDELERLQLVQRGSIAATLTPPFAGPPAPSAPGMMNLLRRASPAMVKDVADELSTHQRLVMALNPNAAAPYGKVVPDRYRDAMVRALQTMGPPGVTATVQGARR